MHLNFSCWVVAPGWTFFTQLKETTAGISKPHHFIKLTREQKKDFGVWEQLLSHITKISFWREEWMHESDLMIQLDASGSTVFEIFYQGKWCAQKCP